MHMHTKDLDTFALPVRFSTIPAFVQIPNYLPIKPQVYAIVPGRIRKGGGGGGYLICDQTYASRNLP